MTAATFNHITMASITSIFRRLFDVSGFGAARFTVNAERALQHDATELTFQLEKNEKVDIFINRVHLCTEPGDMVEFKFKNHAIYMAVITRAEQVPGFAMKPGESLDDFLPRVRAHITRG